MTIFSFKIPVTLLPDEDQRGMISVEECSESEEDRNRIKRYKLIGKNKSMFPQIRKYLEDSLYLKKMTQNLSDQTDQFSRIDTFPS